MPRLPADWSSWIVYFLKNGEFPVNGTMRAKKGKKTELKSARIIHLIGLPAKRNLVNHQGSERGGQEGFDFPAIPAS